MVFKEVTRKPQEKALYYCYSGKKWCSSMDSALEIKELPALLKKHRKMAGLSQVELADLAGVGKTLIFDLEKGHRKIQLEKLLAILKVLNIQIKFEPPQLREHS